MKYDCSCCGETHENMPDLCFDRPDYADSIPDEEAGDRVELDTDLCTVDNEYFFIRGKFRDLPR